MRCCIPGTPAWARPLTTPLPPQSFNTCLVYVSRNKAMLSRSASYEQILKKNEQMYALLVHSPPHQPALSGCAPNLVVVLLPEGIQLTGRDLACAGYRIHALPIKRAFGGWGEECTAREVQ